MKEYSDGHEWLEIENGIACVGITKAAREEIGEVVYIELPLVGRSVTKGSEVCVIESTKAAVDIETPISGTIVEVNSALTTDISLLNKSPESAGWLFKLKV